MTGKRDREGARDPVSPHELARESGEELPDRIAMSLVDTNVAIPVDATIAASVLADESAAADTHAEEDTNNEQGGEGNARDR